MDLEPEPDELQAGFPLFALPIVALPNELVPLHVFEPRYLELVARCLRHDSEFGIVWDEDGEVHDVGCACSIVQVIETSEQQEAVDIVVRGSRPLVVLEPQSHLAFPSGIVSFPDDFDADADADLDADLESRTRAQSAYLELVQRASNREPQPEQIAAMDAFEMAATVDLGCELKQTLLELRSERRRLDLIARVFRAANKRLELVDEAQAKARSNGKVRIV